MQQITILPLLSSSLPPGTYLRSRCAMFPDNQYFQPNPHPASWRHHLLARHLPRHNPPLPATQPNLNCRTRDGMSHSLIEHPNPRTFYNVVIHHLLKAEAECCAHIGLVGRMARDGYAPLSEDELEQPTLDNSIRPRHRPGRHSRLSKIQ